MLLDDLFEGVPNLVRCRLDELLRHLDRRRELFLLQAPVDEGLEELERHLLREAALVQLQLGSDDDDRAARVVHALAEEVLPEAARLALEGVGERLERAVIRPLQDAAAPAVVEEGVDRFLEHPLLVPDDDLRGAELEELLEAVVAVDDPPVEVVQVRRGEPAAVERHEGPQLRRDDRDDVQDHPLGPVARAAESVDDLQPLGSLEPLQCRSLRLHDEAELVGEVVDVDPLEELLDRLGAHLRDERVDAVLRLELAVALFRDQGLLDDVFFVSERPRVDDDVRLEVEDPLEVAQGQVEEVADPAREALEEPDVRDRSGQLDVPHPLAANLGLRHLDAALVADDAPVLHPLVLAAEAFPVGDRPEDLRAEEAVPLRLESPVVDRLRLRDLAEGPGADLLGAGEGDLDRVEVAWTRAPESGRRG